MSSFTDQKPRVFTLEDSESKWGTYGGKLFCTLCNKDFKVGDIWRWIYSYPYGNFTVCESCDGPDVINRVVAALTLTIQTNKGRGDYNLPISLAAQLIAAQEENLRLQNELEIVSSRSNEIQERQEGWDC